MKTQTELIEFYEQRVEKVKAHHSSGKTELEREKNRAYIDHAEADLEAVKMVGPGDRGSFLNG